MTSWPINVPEGTNRL
ncbi:cytochrome P450 9G3, partial [Danaus plexippus plexippus]